jgi:quinol monooxygenase YgiN
MVQLILRLTAAAGRAHQLVEALQPHVRYARRRSGCSAAHLAADVEEADVFWYCEEWDEPAPLEAEIRTEHFAELLAVVETSCEPPLLEFRVIHEAKGLEYVSTILDVCNPASPARRQP